MDVIATGIRSQSAFEYGGYFVAMGSGFSEDASQTVRAVDAGGAVDRIRDVGSILSSNRRREWSDRFSRAARCHEWLGHISHVLTAAVARAVEFE